MNTLLHQILWSTFTFDHALYFTCGMLAAWAWQGTKSWLRHRRFQIKWRGLIWLVCVIVVSFITISTHQASECIRDFNHVLIQRADITAQNDQVSQDQRQLIYNWIHELLFPPPSIARLAPDDPLRQQWAVQITLDTDRAFAKTNAQQQEYNDARAAHPLPTSTCGQ